MIVVRELVAKRPQKIKLCVVRNAEHGSEELCKKKGVRMVVFGVDSDLKTNKI